MEKDEETGLSYHHHRHYAVWLGRWCSSDPIGLGGGINRWAYCSGRPVGRADPNGLDDFFYGFRFELDLGVTTLSSDDINTGLTYINERFDEQANGAEGSPAQFGSDVLTFGLLDPLVDDMEAHASKPESFRQGRVDGAVSAGLLGASEMGGGGALIVGGQGAAVTLTVGGAGLGTAAGGPVGGVGGGVLGGSVGIAIDIPLTTLGVVGVGLGGLHGTAAVQSLVHLSGEGGSDGGGASPPGATGDPSAVPKGDVTPAGEGGGATQPGELPTDVSGPGRTPPPSASTGADKFPGTDPAKAPAGYEWRGRPGSKPGSKEGNYYKPETGETLRPDLDHADPIGPHWDYRDADGNWSRIKPDGTMEPK